MQFFNRTINLSFEHNSPKDFVQSQWQRSKKSCAYVVFRWIIASFQIFSVMLSIITTVKEEKLNFYWVYLTNWNLCLTMIVMIWSACLAAAFYMDRLNVGDKMTKSLKIFWCLSSSTNIYAILISIVYWGVLYRIEENAVFDLNNIVVHGTNSLSVLINLVVVKQPERLSLVVYPLSFGVIYLAFSWLYPLFGGVNK